jgi:hypothetical protein
LSWHPVDPAALPGRVAGWLADRPGTVRVAIDGSPSTEPDALAAALVPLLERAGRPVAHVRAVTFWRDASLRLEHGRTDVDAYLAAWLDTDALTREVLEPVVAGGRWLPSLRDPETNRSTRAAPRTLPDGGVLLVSGPLLLGRGLPFDRTVHLTSSPGARARRTAPDDAWTLPAYDRYDAQTRPADLADLVVKVDDPRHPALRWR